MCSRLPASPSRSTSSRSTKLWTSSSGPSTNAGFARPRSRRSRERRVDAPRLVARSARRRAQARAPTPGCRSRRLRRDGDRRERGAPLERCGIGRGVERPDQSVVMAAPCDRRAGSGELSDARRRRAARSACGDRGRRCRQSPLNSLSRTTPVTRSWTLSTKASSASRSGENHRPPQMMSAYSTADRSARSDRSPSRRSTDASAVPGGPRAARRPPAPRRPRARDRRRDARRMSMRPTPCAPTMVPRLAMRSTSGIATPLTAVGTPRSNASSTYAGSSGHAAADRVSV